VIYNTLELYSNIATEKSTASTDSVITVVFNVKRLIDTGGRATDLWLVTDYTRTAFELIRLCKLLLMFICCTIKLLQNVWCVCLL
jgi:hypothetical protein